MVYNRKKLPLLLERVGVRRLKSTCAPSSQPSPSREKEQELV